MKEYLEYTQIRDEDELTKRIKKIEAMIRNSYEYRCWVKSIHEDLCIHHCAYFKEWTDDEIDMEVHHIIPLYHIVAIIGLDMLSKLPEDGYLLSFDIADKVMEEHLADRIPCVLVSKSIHQAIHAGLYTPPHDSDSIHLGDYLGFVKDYRNSICRSEISVLEAYLRPEDIPELEAAYDRQDAEAS